jgi:chromosome segregation ATPase
MNATIADRKAHLADLRDKKANLEAEIAAAEQALADAQAKRDRYIQLIHDEEVACEEKRQTYFRETAERNEELDVVGQVEQIVNDRILTIDPYLEERVNV